MQRFGYTFFKDTEFITSDENEVCDARSRGTPAEDLLNYIAPPPSESQFHDGCIFGGPAAATIKLLKLADPIAFRDQGIIHSERRIMDHMYKIEKALTEWEVAVATIV
jgi:hypothetical protein